MGKYYWAQTKLGTQLINRLHQDSINSALSNLQYIDKSVLIYVFMGM